MFLLLIAQATAAAAACPVTVVAAKANENMVFFNGVSPEGHELAIGWDRGDGAATQRGAFLLNLRTGKRSNLPVLNNAAAFSPDGRYLVSANYPGDPALKTEVVELDRRTGRIRRFASAPSLEWLPSYSRDGRWIFFNSTRSGASDLYRARRSDGAIEQLTRDPRYEAHASNVEDGRKLLFHRQTEGENYDIVIRDLRTGRERLVGATPTEEAYPALSPDGKWIAFSATSTTGTQPNLYVMRKDGSERRQLTSSTSKDAYAAWAPDGRSLYFVRFDADGSKIMRLPFRSGGCGA